MVGWRSSIGEKTFLLGPGAVFKITLPALLSTFSLLAVAPWGISFLGWMAIFMPLIFSTVALGAAISSPLRRNALGFFNAASVIALLFVALTAPVAVLGVTAFFWLVPTLASTLQMVLQSRDGLSILGLAGIIVYAVMQIAVAAVPGIFINSAMALMNPELLQSIVMTIPLSLAAFLVVTGAIVSLPGKVVTDQDMRNAKSSESLSVELQANGMDGNPDSAQSQNSELSELSEAFSFSLGKKLRIESVNGTPGDVLGFSKENLGGTELSEIVHVDDYQDLCNLVDVELGACKSLNLDAGARIRVRLFTAFCVYQWFEAKVVVGSEKNDNPIVVFRACWFPNQGAEVQPQVAKQAIEGENANMAKMRSDFLANISHELRTPLNAIVGFTDIIKNQLFGPMKNQQYLNYAQLVHDSGQHMMYLVDELLDMSQIEAGTLSMRNTEEIAVKNFLESSLRNFRDQAAESEVAFSFDMNVNSDVITNNRHVVRKMLLHCIKFMLQRASSQSTIRCLLRDYNQESIILTMIAGSCLNSEKNAPTSIAEACMRSEDADISPKTDLQLSLHIARTLAAYAGAEILLSDTEDKTQILSIIFQIRPTNEHFRNLVGKEQADSNQDDVVPERPSGGEARLSS